MLKDATSPRLDQQLQALAEQLSQVLGSLGHQQEQAETRVLRSQSAFGFADQRNENSARLIAASPMSRPVPSHNQLPDPLVIRRIIHYRQIRARYFGDDLFADPAWDMLLDLAAAHANHARIGVTSLCIASGVPTTTALRWIDLMTEAGLLERFKDDRDRRRTFIALSEKAANAFARYFRDIESQAIGLL